MMNRLIGLGLSSVLLVGCPEPEIYDVNNDGIDDGTASTTVIAPSTPTGTVTGLVLDAVTGAPLPAGSVEVELVAGSHQPAAVSVGEDGRFTFKDVPGGTGVSVQISADGYATAWVTRVLVTQSGDFPTRNAHVFVGPVELVPLDGQLRVMVLTPNGQPAEKATVYLDVPFAFFDAGVVQGRLHFEAQTDDGSDTGMALFAGIPDLAALSSRLGGQQLVITVPPYDDAGVDGSPNYDGKVQTVTVAAAASQAAPVNVVLGYPTGATDLAVVASNVADLVGVGGPQQVPTPSVMDKDLSLFIAFNQPVDQDSFLIEMVAERGDALLETAVSANNFNAYGNVVELALPPSVQTGQEYNIYLEARPAQPGTGAAYRGSAAFFITPAWSYPDNKVYVLSFRHIEKTYDSAINANDILEFVLEVPVGARLDNGQAAPANQLMPVRVYAVNLDVNRSGSLSDHPFEANYQGDDPGPKAQLVEEIPGALFRRSGYTSILQLTLPAGVWIPGNGNAAFRLVFNDPVDAAANEIYRVTAPTGDLPNPPDVTGALQHDPGARDAGVSEDAG